MMLTSEKNGKQARINRWSSDTSSPGSDGFKLVLLWEKLSWHDDQSIFVLTLLEQGPDLKARILPVV
ncbi:TPA: hypothetical protein RPP74_004613 [Escherichia coli]|nr:hypothetical protein [Escherichia coli]